MTTNNWNIDTTHSGINFSIRHMVVSKVRGRFAKYTGAINIDDGDLTRSSVEVSIDASSIDTGVADRDTHLRSADFFDVEKYPEITFRSTKIAPRGQNQYDVTGSFTLHGVTKEITVPVTFMGFMGAGPNEKAGFSADFTLNRKDYWIVWNRALDNGGTVLGDDVVISVNIEANPPKPAPPAAPSTK